MPKVQAGVPGSNLSSVFSPLPSSSVEFAVSDGSDVYHFVATSPTSKTMIGQSFVQGVKPSVGEVDVNQLADTAIAINVASNKIITTDTKIEPLTSSALNPSTALLHKNLPDEVKGHVTVTAEGYKPTAPFSIMEAAEFCLQLIPTNRDDDCLFVNVEVDPVGAQFYITINEANRQHPPVKIFNYTSGSIEVRQVSKFSAYDSLVKHCSSLLSSSSFNVVLTPNEETPFAFPVPTATETLQLFDLHSRDIITIHKNRLGVFKPKSGNTIIAYVDTDGPTRVISIYDLCSDDGQALLSRMAKCQLTVADDLVSQGSRTSTVAISVEFTIPAFGISFVSSYPREIAYFGFRGLSINADTADSVTAIEMIVDNIQLLDQNVDAIYPIVFGISPCESNAAFQLRLQINGSHEGVLCFDYVGLLIQPMTLNVSDRFIVKFINSFKMLASAEFIEMFTPPPLITDATTLAAFLEPQEPPINSGKMSRIYIAKLELEPLKISITTDLTPLLLGSGPKIGRAFLSTLGSLSQVNLKFPSLHLSFVFEIPSIIIQRFTNHYMQAGLREAYKVVGATDAIGAPYSLFNHLGTGLKDLYYEPYQGFLSHSPLKTVEGIGTGVGSVAKHTWQGAFGVVSSLTGSISRLSAGLSMDDDFVRKQSRAKPQHVGEGFLQGTNSLGRGIWSGVSGIVRQPISGAKNGGFGGAMKGFGKGLVGVVSKPVAGVAGFASSVSEGLKQTVEFRHICTIRTPRWTRKKQPLLPFSQEQSFKQSVLWDLQSGKYSKHDVVETYATVEGDFMVTSKHLMLFEGEKMKLVWKLHVNEVASFSHDHTRLIFTSKENRGKSFVATFPSEEIASIVIEEVLQDLLGKK
ncbi:hypothetical protein GEMRC1_007431 [Eukaryota sp. GEM-RC1]